jgi:hypothetical protein
MRFGKLRIQNYVMRIQDITATHYRHTRNALHHRALGLPTRLRKKNKQQIGIAERIGHVLRIHETNTTARHRRDLRMRRNLIAILNRRIFVIRDMRLGAEHINGERVEFRLRKTSTTILR